MSYLYLLLFDTFKIIKINNKLFITIEKDNKKSSTRFFFI